MTMPPRPPETLDDRKGRQYVWLRDLGERSMALAHNSSDAALREDEAERSAQPPARPRPARDHRLDFCRVCRNVRQIIALEMRLDAPPRASATRPAFVRPNRPPDPRRDLLRRVFHETVAKEPDRIPRRREIDEHIDQHLDADPEQRIPLPDIVTALSESLGIELDYARVPDEFVGLPPNPNSPYARASPARRGARPVTPTKRTTRHTPCSAPSGD